jgi:hypothetical protein
MEYSMGSSGVDTFLRTQDILKLKIPIEHVDELFYVLNNMRIAPKLLNIDVEERIKKNVENDSVMLKKLLKVQQQLKQMIEFVDLHALLYDGIFQLRGSVKPTIYEDGILKAIKNGDASRGIILFNSLHAFYYYMLMDRRMGFDDLKFVQKTKLFDSFSNKDQKRKIKDMKVTMTKIDVAVVERIMQIGTKFSDVELQHHEKYANNQDLLRLKENLLLLSAVQKLKKKTSSETVKNFYKILDMVAVALQNCNKWPDFKVVLKKGSVVELFQEFSKLKLLKQWVVDRCSEADNIPLNKD